MFEERKITREKRLTELKTKARLEETAKFVFLAKHERALAIQLVGAPVYKNITCNGKRYDIFTKITIADVAKHLRDPSKVNH